MGGLILIRDGEGQLMFLQPVPLSIPTSLHCKFSITHRYPLAEEGLQSYNPMAVGRLDGMDKTR